MSRLVLGTQNPRAWSAKHSAHVVTCESADVNVALFAQFADIRRLESLKLKSVLDIDADAENDTSNATIIKEIVKKQFLPKSITVEENEEEYVCKVRVHLNLAVAHLPCPRGV